MEEIQNHKKYSEAALRLKAIIETATDGIITINERGIMEMINPAAANLFGYRIAELEGKNISMLMPEPDSSRHDQYMQNYYDTGKAKIIGIGREVKGKTKDGTIFPLRLSISEVKLQERRIFTGIIHDLTEQKRVESALREEKEKAQMYFDFANTINLVLDRNGAIQKINKKGCEILRHQESDVLGRDYFELVIPEEDREQFRENYTALMEAQEEFPEYFENVIINNEGERRLIAWRNSLLRDKEGETAGVIASGLDITEQRAAEDNIKKLNAELEERVEQRTEELATAVNKLLAFNKQLEYEVTVRKAAEDKLKKNHAKLQAALEKEKELSELKSRFVSMASHEFRTPLSTILSSADLIEAYKKEEQQTKRERHTKRIKSSVANLTSILNDFLSLSKLEEGRIESHPTAFVLYDFVEEVFDELQGLLKPGQTIRLNEFDRERIVVLDKKMLKNILFNLCSNAIKYSDDPIDCEVDLSEGRMKITIRDYGIGIPEEEQQHLFTRFFRAHNVENIQGTGLGLNIVKRYVDLMNGHIQFESKLGEGTTIVVDFALDKPTAD